jgi:Rod binding domain-containing protein
MDISLSPPVAANPFGQVLPKALAHAPKASTPMSAAKEKAMRETAQEFEAVFIGQMTEAMFAGLETEEPFGGGHAEKMWRSQLSQEMGRSISASGGIGIAESVYRSMIAQQEAALNPGPHPAPPTQAAAAAYAN